MLENFPQDQNNIQQKESSHGAGQFFENHPKFARAVRAGALALSLGGMPSSSVEPVKQETFAELIARAKNELKESGITSEQRSTYTPVNDILYKGIEPKGYESGRSAKGNVETFLIQLKEDRPTIKNINNPPKWYDNRFRREDQHREDAWKLYLGIPQSNGTFGISDYQPTRRTEQKYYFKINDYWDNLSRVAFNGNKQVMIETIINIWFEAARDEKLISPSGVDRNAVMGEYTLSKGKDERGSYISYYDKWDLDQIPVEKKGFFGKPFEIYDRLYYNPETFEPIE